MDPSVATWYIVLTAAILASLAVVIYLSHPRGRWRRVVQERLVLGVPWGTLIVVTGVALFYLFVQDGLANPHNPVDIPFRASSYYYPLGMVTAGFAHSSLSHVTSNLLTTLVFGSLAEYAWSHYPQGRRETPQGRREPTVATWLSNPYIRILVWVCAIVVVTITTSMFGLGPVIGFSGTFFAFVGFALVRYPIATIVAALSTRIVTQLYNAIRYPEVQQTAAESFSRPWWAGIAIQGHALGIMIGATLGVALLYHRDVRPKPEHVWLAALAFAVDRGLWAIYLPEGSDTYRLFRALGMAAVFVLAALFAGGATATTKELLPRVDLSRREAAYGLLVVAVVIVAAVAIPLNLYAVDDPSVGIDDGEPVTVEDYTIFYAEDVENQFVPAVPLYGDLNTSTERIKASGIIVVSEQRNIWWEEVSAARLESRGSATVRIGGLTWNRGVRATRTTWRVTGGNSTHHVRLGLESAAERDVVYRAEPAPADTILDGRNVSIQSTGDRFEAVVFRNGNPLGTTDIPKINQSVTAGGLTFVREERNLYVERGNTRVRIAQRSK